MTKPVPTHNLTGKPLGNRPDREKTEEILQRLRQAANDRHPDGFSPGAGDDQVQALENVLFPSAQQEKTGTRFPVLIAVFMISAIAGGAIAGLYLARNGAKPPVPQVADARPAGMIMEKNVAPREETAAAASGTYEKDQAQLVAEVSPAGDTAGATTTDAAPQPIAPPPLEAETTLEKPPVAEAQPAAAPAGAPSAPTATADTTSESAATAPDGELAQSTTQVVQDLERQLPRPADFDAAAGKTGGAGATAPATGGADASAQSPDELKALTDNVVQALGSLIPGAEGTTEPASTSDLRNALSALVDKAMQEGRSKNEIISLLDKAIEEAGAENIPEELLGPDGKVDLNLLIASVIPKDMTMVSSQDRSYVNQLLAEGRNTSLKGQKAPKAKKDRFYTRNGRRYTRIRRGDTLAQIAYDAYGDALAYPRILRANSGRISVRNLRPGMEIRVPGKNERLTDTAEPASLVQGAKATRKAATRKRVTTRRTARRTTAGKTARKRQDTRRRQATTRRQAAPRRKTATKPKITDRLLGVIGATTTPQGQAAATAQAKAKPADEPSLTTNFQRYKVGTPPPGN